MKRPAAAVVAVAAVTILQACNVLGAEDCTTDIRMAIRVTVTDSAIGAPISSGGAIVIATDGAFADTAQVHVDGVTGLVKERPGRYRVVVEAPGYKPWVRGGVRVRSDDCHVITERIEARLQRAPGAFLDGGKF